MSGKTPKPRSTRCNEEDSRTALPRRTVVSENNKTLRLQVAKIIRSGKRQAELEQTRLREAEKQTRESPQHKVRSEISPHDLRFRSPKNDPHKSGPSESFMSDQNVRTIPSIEPMEPFGTTTFGNDVVSASDELTWDPEDYLKATTVCDVDVKNAYSNLGEKVQGCVGGLDSASLSIGCTAMVTTTRCPPSSPTKTRRESNTDRETGPHYQAFAAFHNACVDGKCDHRDHVTGYTHKDNSLAQKIPECHRNKIPTIPFTPIPEKLQHRTSGDLEMFSGSYGVSNRGKTALHISAERGNGGIVRLLILHGADVNGIDSWGRTALHYACGRASVDVVTQLLKGGADPDICDHEGRSPLHAAVEVGCDTVVCLLAKEGADLNAVIGFGSGGSVQDSFEIIEA